ncbi:MAG TPA: hypothetical protein VJ873_13930, partial [bacterium]|nr:hypothetical protein [bacterium]
RDPNGVSTAPGGLLPNLIDPNTGYFILSSDPASPFFVNDFNFIEGQNEIVFHTIDWAGKESFQRLRFTLSTLPFYIFPQFPGNDTLVKGDLGSFDKLLALSTVPILSDASGNTIAAVYTSFKIFKDGQPPSQNFIATNPTAFQQNSVTINSGFESATTLVADIRQMLTDATGNTISGHTIPDGKYDVLISAYSPFTGSANPTNTQFTFTVDNEPPVFNIFNPVPVTIVEGVTVDSHGNPVTTASAVEPAIINPWLGRPNSDTGPATFVMGYSVTDMMSPLVNSVTFSVVDSSGNPISSPFNIATPTPAPVPFESLGGYSVPWVAKNVTFGTASSVILKVRGANAAGSPGSASVTVYLDRAPPIPLLDTPYFIQTQQSGTSSPSLPVSVVNSNTLSMAFPYHFGKMNSSPGLQPVGGTAIFTFQDADNNARVLTFTHPTLPGLGSGTNQFSLDYTLGSPTALPDGIWNVTLTAIDAAGNSVNSATSDPNFTYLIPPQGKSLLLKVDRTPPVVSNVQVAPFEVPAGAANIQVAYGINEDLDASELNSANGGVPAPTVVVDIEDTQGNVKIAGIPGGNNFNATNLVTVTLPSSPALAAGQYLARVTTTDWAGNQNSSIASFVYQQIPPAITAPSMGATVGGKVIIQGTAVDPDWTTPNTFLGYTLYYKSGVQSLPGNLSPNGLSTWSGSGDARISVLPAYQIPPPNPSPTPTPQANHSFQAVTGGTLGYWDTTNLGTGALADGNYTLLLVVSDSFVNSNGQSVTEYQGITQPVTVSQGNVVIPPLNANLFPPSAASPMTFSPNPADPNNAVTFAYGLAGSSANTRFEI